MAKELATSGIKLSDMEPCSFCNGTLAPMFYVMVVKFAMFGRGTQEVLGLTQYWGGGSAALALAEVFAPNADEAVVVAEDQALNQKLFVCQRCYLGPLDVVGAIDRVSEERRKREENKNAKVDRVPAVGQDATKQSD